MSRTKIEWADAVWNPVTGCTPVSEGCQNCYARRFAQRLRGRCGYPDEEPFQVVLHPERLEQPRHWRKPRRVFVCSMGDLFHPDVPAWYINQVWLSMMNNSQHTYLVLTKRPERLLAWTRAAARAKAWPADEVWPWWIWVGVTAENQARADERIPILLQIPAAVRWVSCEPLLGPIDLRRYMRFGRDCYPCPDDNCAECGPHYDSSRDRFLDWVVAGGETGPGARPCHPDWVRRIRDDCVAVGVPFFFKSWGDWWPSHPVYGDTDPIERYEDLHPNFRCEAATELTLENNGAIPGGIKGPERWSHYQPRPELNPWRMLRVGRKAAGRLLDGRTWDEIPGVSASSSAE